ncbi:MAG: ABC transporter ATP-binding protein [Candidatus Korarchaeota archaeon]|nr:ABC transporter ATP-binding protein [Candidatus Korarchaeota archaeon]
MKKGEKPVLKIENLSFKFHGSKENVLKNINLELYPREFVLLIGPSGCGKTTLINTINGIIPHIIQGVKKGKVYVNGVDVDKVELKEISTLVGTVFQDPETQFFTLSVIDEVVFGPENLMLPVDEIEKRFKFAVKATGIEDLLDKDIMSLSGGQKQRVAIASALAMMPKVLILDEPTTNLDPKGAAEVLKTISKLRQETDALIILIEHRLEEVAKYADKVLVMNDGQIIAQGDAREIFGRPKILYDLGIRPPWSAESVIRLKNLGILPDDAPIPINPEEAAKIIDKYLKSAPTLVKPNNLPFENYDEFYSYENRKPVIEIKNLWHRYPDGTIALKGINLTIREGEFVGIIGQNGAGKSTLLLHILGLLRPSHGSVKVFGKEASRMSVAELARSIGLIFQNPDLMLFQNTVWDEIAFGPQNVGLPKTEIRERVKEAIEMMRLIGFEKRHPRALSRGQRHRVAVASILSMRPKILIADEPTTGQDYGASKKYLQLLTELNKAGSTIIVVSHDMDLIARFSKRVIVLKQGKILIDGPTRAVFSREDLLKETHLAPPYVTRIGNKLKNFGIPTVLTIEELVEAISSLYLKKAA